MASRRPSTKANPNGPPATLVSNPEEILRKVRDLLRQTNSATQTTTLGISRNIYTIISYAKTLNSQEFINTSENSRVWASLSSTTCEDMIPGDSSGISRPLPSQHILHQCYLPQPFPYPFPIWLPLN